MLGSSTGTVLWPVTETNFCLSFCCLDAFNWHASGWFRDRLPRKIIFLVDFANLLLFTKLFPFSMCGPWDVCYSLSHRNDLISLIMWLKHQMFLWQAVQNCNRQDFSIKCFGFGMWRHPSCITCQIDLFWNDCAERKTLKSSSLKVNNKGLSKFYWTKRFLKETHFHWNFQLKHWILQKRETYKERWKHFWKKQNEEQ